MGEETKVENEQAEEGNALIFGIEIGVEVFKMRAFCPICNDGGFWVSKDRLVIVCAGCRAPIALRYEDNPVTSEPAWNLT